MVNMLYGKTVSQVRKEIDGDLESLLLQWTNEGMTSVSIGAMLSVHHRVVYGWLRKLGLSRNRSEANRIAWQYGRFDREKAQHRAYDTQFNLASKGRLCPWKGQQLPPQWRDNISQGMTGTRVGANHPGWKGGAYSHYGSGWKRAKRIALERANGQCEKCHTTPSNQRCDVHHKIPVRCFSDIADAHAQTNLIVLCRLCHHSAEKEAMKALPLWFSDIPAKTR